MNVTVIDFVINDKVTALLGLVLSTYSYSHSCFITLKFILRNRFLHYSIKNNSAI